MANWDVLNDANLSLTTERARTFFVNTDAGATPPPPTPVPPVVGNFAPATGTAIAATTLLSFDVTDDSGLFRRIIVAAQFPNLGIYEVIHEGVGFAPKYRGAGNLQVAITNGFRYTILREGGWPASPSITVFAIDQGGAEAL